MLFRLISDLKFRAMGQAVGSQPLALEAWLRTRDKPCVICDAQSGTDPGFPPSTSIFPCQYSSSKAPYSFIHLHATLSRRKNGRSLGTFQNQRSLRYRGALESKVMSLFKPEVTTVSSFRLSNRT